MARSARIHAWWADGFDLLLSPTMIEPALRNDEMAALDSDAKHAMDRRQCTFTEPFNISAHPAITVPLHWTPDGLPDGVQIAAGRDRDDPCAAVARQLEQVRPWQVRPWVARRPPGHA